MQSEGLGSWLLVSCGRRNCLAAMTEFYFLYAVVLLHKIVWLSQILCMTGLYVLIRILCEHPTIFCFPIWITHKCKVVSSRWCHHNCCWGLYYVSGWELEFYRNPSNATLMQEACQLRECIFGQNRLLDQDQPMIISAHHCIYMCLCLL